MRAWQLEAFGLANLKLSKQTEKKLADDEVRVAMRACSLNYRDLMVARGHYNPKQVLPLIPVSDGAGEVIEVGKGVKDFRVGDRVCATFSQQWDAGRTSEEAQNYTLGSPLPGVLSEQGVFKEKGLIAFPHHLSFIEASCLPCAAVTAFNALVYEADLKAGSSVLIEGTGGVSISALLFAKALGLESIVLTSSSDKAVRLKELGAQHVINYKLCEDWPLEVRKLSKNQGVDAVIEVGGQATLPKALRSLKRGGMVCMIGILSGLSAEIDLVPILMRQLRIIGIFVGSKSIFCSMNRVIEHSRIKPVVDKVFAFDKAPLAFKYLESAQHFGKVCIEL